MATQQGLPALSRSFDWPGAVSRPRRDWRRLTAGLLLLDGGALMAAFALAYLLRFKGGLPLLQDVPHQLSFYSSVAFSTVPIWLGIFALFHLYDRHNLFAGFGEYIRVVNAVTCGIMATIAVSFLDQGLFISRGWLMLVWVFSILTVGGTRFAFRRVLRLLRARGHLVARTVILGANEEGRALAEQFLHEPGCGVQVIGFVDDSLNPGAAVVDNLGVLGAMQDLNRIIGGWDVDEIIVAMTAVTREDLLDLIRNYGHMDDLEIRLSSGLFEILTTGVRVTEVNYVPLVTPQRTRITGVDAFLKAAVDYTGALLGLIVASPLLLAITLLVKLDSPGPALHRRRVVGRGGKPFDAFKFRTMVTNADELLRQDPTLREAFEKGYKLKVDPRVTRVGRFLRRTSLDELPQLLNVLRGEMSLVGPRMIAPDEVARYGKWQTNLLTVKPGITGPWQVQGRSDISYEDRVRLSTQYIRNYTIWSDLEILLRTVPAVLKSRGAY
jgi:exopolysaccharide biosynthesis polyprenyl glycosylphosphotransferase